MRNIWVVYQVKYYTNSMLMIYQKVNIGEEREGTTQAEAHLRCRSGNNRRWWLLKSPRRLRLLII